MAKNIYEYKSDSQLIMLGLAVLIKEMDYEGLNNYVVETLEGLSDELANRGGEVRKASKFYPDEKIERRDNDK